MTTCVEGDLEISFPSAWKICKFDGPSHRFNEMKAVDFIAESSNLIAFIEVKDPNNPRIPPGDRKKIVDGYKSEKNDFELKYKFRDSFLYEWASGRVHKPIHYWVLIAADSFSATQLLRRSESLRRKLPVAAASPKDWKESIADNCIVFNIKAWNNKLPGCQVVRISTRNQPKGSGQTP